MENKVIVFGSNSISALGIVRSLGEYGVASYCILTGLKQGFAFSSKYPKLKLWVSDLESGLEYIRTHFSAESFKPIILCGDDWAKTLIDQNLDSLKKQFILSCCDVEGKVTYLMDKITITKWAQQYGFKSPLSYIVKKGQQLPSGIEYPCFTKSLKTTDGGKSEECVCKTREELSKTLIEFKSEEFIVQQYIDKKDEYCLQGFVVGKEVFIPYIEHFYRFPDEAYGGYVHLERFVDTDFYNQVKKLILSTKYQGLFSVEFLLDKQDNLFFTEINFRHDGLSYFTTSGGASLPFLYCKMVAGDIINLV